MKEINGELLSKAIEEIAMEQMYAELREWLMSSPLTVNRVYGRYIELLDKEVKTDE